MARPDAADWNFCTYSQISSTVYHLRSLGLHNCGFRNQYLGISCQKRPWLILTYNLHARLVFLQWSWCIWRRIVWHICTSPGTALKIEEESSSETSGCTCTPIYTASEARRLEYWCISCRGRTCPYADSLEPSSDVARTCGDRGERSQWTSLKEIINLTSITNNEFPCIRLNLTRVDNIYIYFFFFFT